MYEFEKKKLLNYINEDVLEILEVEECFIGGGAITSLFTRTDINDIDIYFRSKESLVRALKDLKNNCTFIAHTDKATMFVKDKSEYAYQFIHFKYFENAEELFETFDFTVCMGAYDFKTGEFILHKDFLAHNSQRMLKFNQNTAYPIVSALRVQKYINKGYTISKPEFIKIMLTINQLDIKTYKQLKEQMGGMYGVNYDKLFKDIRDDDKFDVNVVIEKLSDLVLEDDYFNLPQFSCNESDIDKMINSLYVAGSYEIYRKTLNKDGVFMCDTKDYYVIVLGNEIIDVINVESLDVSEERLSKESKEITVYKNVEDRGSRYYSYWNENFEYKLNQEIAADNKKEGLHFSKDIEDVNDGIYCSSTNRVILKAKVYLDDMLGDLRFKKCIPLEIIKK